MATLLIIAPNLPCCWATARAHGFSPPAIENFRNVSRAYQLRGVGPGQPFITHDRENWPAEARELDELVTALTRVGRLRIAEPADIENSTPFAGVPYRARWGKREGVRA